MAKKSNKNVADPFEDDGFTVVSTPDRYWWVKEDDDGNLNPIRGLLLRRVETQSDDDTLKHQYVIELTAPTLVAKGSRRDGDLETFVAEPGTIVYADETYQCSRDLSPLVRAANAAGRLLEVIITPVKKRAIGGARKVWNASVKARVSDRQALVLPDIPAPAQLPEASDDIPF